MQLETGNTEITKSSFFLRAAFVGAQGMRSGWRLLIFFAILAGLIAGLQSLLMRLPRLGEWYAALLHQAQFDPVGALLNEAINVGALLITLWLMTKIERRRIGDYGWRPQVPGAKRRWAIGFLFGVVMVAAMYTLQWSEHVYSFGSWALPPGRALAGGVLWFAACFLVGVFEEGTFRGYVQFTLGRGIGFWAAAFTISVAFGFIHLLDANYTIRGVGGPVIFGLLFAFCLWRTGDLWLAVGIHAAVDFAELFIFAPAHSFSSAVHLLNADLHGPAWLTGWTIGPEASVNGYAVLALAFVAVWAGTRKPDIGPPPHSSVR